MRWLVCCAVLALGGCAAVSGAPAGPPLDPQVAAGRELAQRGCSGCHGMTPDRASIDHRAPPFWTLAARHNPGSLAQATRTAPGHDRLAMPSIVLDPDDAAALVAYMKALGTAPRSAWRRLDVSPCIATARC